jgi:membrane-associated protein
MHFDLQSLIETVGYFGLFAIVFAESGLLIGFFLPGDSLLFTAGLLASQGHFNIWILLPLTFVAAVAGDSVGYAFGKKVGPRLFKREDSLLFRRENIEHAQAFYDKHGGKTLILARFTPIVRTFAPILALARWSIAAS